MVCSPIQQMFIGPRISTLCLALGTETALTAVNGTETTPTFVGLIPLESHTQSLSSLRVSHLHVTPG